MKKAIVLAILTVTAVLAQSAWATITISANPSSQFASANSTFTVQFSLAVTGGAGDPTSVSGVDLFIQAVNSQNGGLVSNLFSIASQAPASGWLAAGPGDYPDPFQTTTVHTAGNAENMEDQAVTKNVALVPPFGATLFETLTFNVGNIPEGIYNFSTTTPSSTTDGRGTHITNTQGLYFIPTTQASFSIGIPEPATWSLFGLGALGAFGLNLLRERRKG